MSHVENQQDNPQLALVEYRKELLTVTKIQIGAEDHVPTLTGRAGHGGESILEGP